MYPEVSKGIVAEDLSARRVEILHVLEGKKLAPSDIIGALLNNPVSARTLRHELQILKDKGYVDAEGPLGWADRTIKSPFLSIAR